MVKPKTKAIKARVGDPSQLPTVEETKEQIRTEMRGMTRRLQSDVDTRSKAAQERFEARRKALVTKQKTHREALKQQQAMQFQAANKIRQARFRAGISGVWDRLRGEHGRIQTQNEHEAYAECRRNQQMRDALVFRHLRERQQIEIFKLRHRDKAQSLTQQLEQDRRQYQRASPLYGPEP